MKEQFKELFDQAKSDAREMREKQLEASGLSLEQGKHLKIIGWIRIISILGMLIAQQPYQMVIHTYFFTTFCKIVYLNISSSHKGINDLKKNAGYTRMLETFSEEFVLRANKMFSFLYIPIAGLVLYWIDYFIVDIASNYIN